MRLEVVRDFLNGQQLASKAAEDLAQEVLELLSKQSVNLVLTGGSVGIKTLSELAPLLVAKDLSGLHLWWGDERFVEERSSERNYVQAVAAMISKISIPAKNLHPMPASGDKSLIDAASEFAQHLGDTSPQFDIVLLGMGSDGHVASLFPGSDATVVTDLVSVEKNSPKAPAERISLSIQALSSATEVWFLVSGSDKANAVKRVFDNEDLPAAKVTGKKLTRWYLDAQAASELSG
jgi:6-phosphogluconolactonase